MGAGASGNLHEVVETTIGLGADLEDQLEHKKKEQEDSKNLWSKLLSHQQNMTLNVASMDGKTKAVTPLENLLEVMSYPTLAKYRAKTNATLERAHAKVNLPLMLVKSLITGE